MTRDRDTENDLLRNHFSATAWSRALARPEEVGGEVLERFLAAYWRPAYLYIRRDRAKTNDEAKDLTQEFFLHLVVHDVLRRFRPEAGRLRTFLKVSLKNFLTSLDRKTDAQRRGGGRAVVSFDAMEVDRLDGIASSGESPDDLFDREWAYDLLVEGLESLRRKLKPEAWSVYELYDLEGATGYRDIATRLGLTESQVTKHLAHARQQLRRELLDRLSTQVTGQDELHQEMRELLGD